jgi:hypothetical protein
LCVPFGWQAGSLPHRFDPSLTIGVNLFLAQLDSPLLLADADGAFAALPQWALVVVGIVGVVLWLFGHATLKFGFGVIGLIAGGLAGYIVPGILGAGVHPGIPAAVGAVIGLLAGLIGFKLSVGLIQGTVAGVIGGLLVFIAVAPNEARELREESLQGPAKGLELEVSAAATPPEAAEPPEVGDEPTPEAVDEAKKWLESHAKDGEMGKAVDMARASAEDLRDKTKLLAERVRPVWNDLSRENRTAVTLGAVGAGTVGFGLGMFFPKRSSALVTGVAGAMLWVPALLELMSRGGVRAPVIDADSTAHRIVLIGVAAVIGTCIQWAMTRRPADKA